MKHVFIFDPKSFRDQQWRMDSLFDSIGQYFRTLEKPDFSTAVSNYPRSAIGLIQKQVDQADMFEIVRVYAIGGDEIFFDCLNGIAGLSHMELAALPHGAGINFLRSFGEGKAELFKDIQSLAEASTIPTDIITVGNNYAINGCSAGLVPAIAMKMRKRKKKFGKGFSRFFLGFLYFLDNVVSFFDKELIAQQYKITIDGNDYSGRYSLVNIVNAPYFNSHKALAGALPNDGLLDVVLFKSGGPLPTWGSLKKYSRGRMPSNCIRVQAKKIEIESEKPMWIQTDSEFLQDTSITFEVVSQTVQVVAVNDLVYQGF